MSPCFALKKYLPLSVSYPGSLPRFLVLCGLLVCSLSALAQIPANLPANAPQLPSNIPISTLPQGVSPQVNSGVSRVQDETANRAVVGDARAKAYEDSIRLLRERGTTGANDSLAQLRNRVFGSRIFTGNRGGFAPSINTATPRNYLVGPGDQLIINIYGYSSRIYTLRVTPEGNVNFDLGIGPVKVTGLTIEQVEQKLTDRLAERYVGLKGPNRNTYLQVNLGDVKAIRVNINGEAVTPGTYQMNSLSTVYTALYAAGGPSEIGTYRNIKLLRRDRVIATVDLYDYLVNGVRSNDVALQDDDVIFIERYRSRVDLTGRVKTPALFELKPGEKLGDVFNFAGGFAEGAYTLSIQIQRFTKSGKRLIDVPNEQIQSVELQNGDVIGVGDIPDRVENEVLVAGSVFRPGSYSLDSAPTLKGLLARAEGVTPDAFLGRATIIRRKDDLTEQIIPVNLERILSGRDEDVALQWRDRLEVKSVAEMRENRVVRIQGEVLKRDTGENEQGYYPWYEGMTVEDLIIAAGGFTRAASASRVEVSRPKRLESDDLSKITSVVSETFTFSISRDLKVDSTASRFFLLPNDEVFVRPSPNFESTQTVRVEGQILVPGDYPITDRNERISDIIKRAGGVNNFAYIPGASLIRQVKASQAELNERNRTLNEISDDSRNAAVVAENVTEDKQETIGIDLQRILKNPHSEEDLILQEGDIINIPKYTATVRVQGEVLHPTTTRYTPNVGVLEYISRSGGFTARSLKRRTYVLYANGFVQKTRRFLFFNSYPEVRPGSEVIVPVRTKDDITTQGVLNTIGQISATLTGLVSIILAARLLQGTL
jgi:protein involved in polysaccharide export with SLBB domain